MIATKLARSLGVGDGANGGPNTKHRDTTFGMTRKIAHRLGQFVKPTFSTSGKVRRRAMRRWKYVSRLDLCDSTVFVAGAYLVW